MNFTAEMLSTAQACALLGVDRSTLTRWVKAGRIQPAVKLPTSNGAYLFNASDVDSLLKARS